MDDDCHVEVVGPHIVRVAVTARSRGTGELTLQISNDGLYWVTIGAVELGEATPIVSSALRSLIDSMAKGPKHAG